MSVGTVTLEQHGRVIEAMADMEAERNRALAAIEAEGMERAAVEVERDEALSLLREMRANHRRPFGGWAPYDLAARVDDFLARVDGNVTRERKTI